MKTFGVWIDEKARRLFIVERATSGKVAPRLAQFGYFTRNGDNRKRLLDCSPIMALHRDAPVK